MESSNNVFKFQGSNMIVCAKGPNIDKNINMSTSFRSNIMSSTLNMPRNFEKQSYTESVLSQRSIYGRETSPTGSIRSDLQSRNIQQPFYQRGFSQRSVYNGRGGSPVSMRSIDSSVSVATDIVQAISSGKLNKYECKMIKQALNNRRKYDFWKRAEKRRKMQMYLKKIRNRSGDESGEPWSSSSSSSDDCASTRTGYSRRYDKHFKENVPHNINNRYEQEEIFRNDDRDIYGGYDRPDSQNPYQRNIDSYPANIHPYQREPRAPSNTYFSQKIGLPNKSTLYSQHNSLSAPKHLFSSQMNVTSQGNMFSTQRNPLNSSICSTKSMQNMTMMSQRDRFRGGFQFPSQKFNKSSLIHEQQEQNRGQQFPNKECANIRKKLLADQIDENSDENNDIFLDTTLKPNPVTKKSGDPRLKRKADSLSDIPISAKKKPKTTTNKNDKTKNQAQTKVNNEKNDFEFAKPQLPIRKSAPAKSREKLISKSSNAPEIVFDAQEENVCLQPVVATSPEPEDEHDHINQSENTQMTTSDMSMRPSFMKRKLFTQTLDVTIKKNNSSDSVGTASPQNNIYSALSREKHKTRKLVTSQSLLSRDIQDDNNLLHLIHKIVPPNCSSNITKSFNARISGSKTGDDDKLDITSIITTGNNDSVSETYTDDEIFKVANDEKNSQVQEKHNKRKTDTGKNKAASSKTENNKAMDTTNAKLESKKSIDIGTKAENKKANNTSAKSENKKVNDINNKPESKKSDNSSSKSQIKKTNTISKPEIKKTSCTTSKPDNKKINDTSAKPASKQTNDNINKISKVVLNKIVLPALTVHTPVKASPVKKVFSSSRIDAFWNTDVESDYECVATPRAPRPARLQALHDQSRGDLASPKQNSTETRTTNSSTKITTRESSPVVTRKNDTTLVKVLKKEAKKTLSDDPEPKTKKSNDQVTPPRKRGRPKRGTPVIKLQTNKQINQSMTSETTRNPRHKKVSSPNKTAPVNSTSQKKQGNEKKVVQAKNSVSKSSLEVPAKTRKLNSSQHQINNSKKLEDTPKSQRRVKTIVQKPSEQEIDMTCKNLRSRAVDLSSSFNSDKFELTMLRARKSRTPSKRISFNKSKNIAISSKTRGRATKA